MIKSFDVERPFVFDVSFDVLDPVKWKSPYEDIRVIVVLSALRSHCKLKQPLRNWFSFSLSKTTSLHEQASTRCDVVLLCFQVEVQASGDNATDEADVDLQIKQMLKEKAINRIVAHRGEY